MASSDGDDSSSPTHIDRPGEEEADKDTSEVQDNAHGSEESEDEIQDEDGEDETGEHVYLKQIQEDEVAPVYQLETSLGKQIAPFIDDSQLVRRFDRKRKAIRSIQDVRAQQQYMYIASIIKDKLSNKFEQLTCQIEDWKKVFLHDHGTHPSPSDVPEHIAQTMKKRQTLKKIIFHEWKLILH